MSHGDLAGASEQSQIIGLASTVQTAAATVTPRRSEWAGTIEWIALAVIAAAVALVLWKLVMFVRRIVGG